MAEHDPYEQVRREAVNVALREEAKGVREVGAQNRGPEIDKYKLRSHSPLSANHAWCGFFIYYCYTEAAQRFSAPLPFGSGVMWSGPKLKSWAEANPAHLVTSSPCYPGDVYVMSYGHIGMVVSQSADTWVYTIDGNQSSMGKGLSLKQCVRNINDMSVIIRITKNGDTGYGWK